MREEEIRAVTAIEDFELVDVSDNCIVGRCFSAASAMRAVSSYEGETGLRFVRTRTFSAFGRQGTCEEICHLTI